MPSNNLKAFVTSQFHSFVVTVLFLMPGTSSCGLKEGKQLFFVLPMALYFFFFKEPLGESNGFQLPCNALFHSRQLLVRSCLQNYNNIRICRRPHLARIDDRIFEIPIPRMLFHGPPRLCHSILPHSLLSTGAMQKRIETFFVSQTVKKAKTGTIDQSREVCSSSARDDNEGWRVSEKDKIEETESIHLRKETEIEGGGDVKGDQIQKMQELRALGNRNDALAKQAVIRTERSGDLPMLGDLLVEPSWRDLLDKEMNKTYFKSLETFVRGEWNSHMIFPPKHAVFRAFNTCPVQEVRVVILGQDPYHDLGQAQGLSFSVPKGKQLPSSLRNIYKELNEDIGCPRGSHGCLEKWAHQGVLLLNAVLTVRAHNAASHAKRGWETFTSEAIARLSRERKGLVFLLWGKYAQEKGKVIDRNNGHHILTSAHPSGLSASRGFFGCRHFSKCNELLVSQGDLPIDWCIHD